MGNFRTVKKRLAVTSIALAILAVTASVPHSAYACESSTAPVGSTAPVDDCEQQFGCVG
jgi:hypothetical protein